MRRIKKPFLAMFLLLIGILVLTQASIPYLLAGVVESGLRSIMPEAEEIRARLRGFPALAMLMGHVSHLEVWIKRVPVSGLWLEEVYLFGRDVQLNLKILNEKNSHILHRGELTVEAVITEKSLGEYLSDRFTWLYQPKVDFYPPDTAEISCQVYFLGEYFPLKVKGSITTEEGRWLKYRPLEIAVVGWELPESLIQFFSEELTFRIDMSDGRYPLRIDRSVIQDDRLLVIPMPTGL
jgi:hypothetical protein